MPPKTLYKPWPTAVVAGAVAEVLASTGYPGLSNSEIGLLLAVVGVADVQAQNKRIRLWTALHNRQVRDGASNCVIRFNGGNGAGPVLAGPGPV